MRSALRSISFAFTCLLLATPCSRAAERAPIPQRLSIYIGGFLGASYQLDLRDATLEYSASEAGRRNPRQTMITPTPAQWREFRQALDELKVWRWRAEYHTPGAIDGTQWGLEISYPDRSLKTKGNNRYPEANGKPSGKPEQTETFRRYLMAVQKLTGGRAFQ